MPYIGLILAILSGFLLVGRNYYGKKLINSGFRPFTLLLSYSFFGFIVLSAYLLIKLLLSGRLTLPSSLPLPLILIYLILYSLSGLLYFHLLKHLPLSTMIPLFGSLPIFSALSGLLFLGEALHPTTYLGILITSCGSILIGLKANHSKNEKTNLLLLSLALANLVLYAFQSAIQKKLILSLGVDFTLWFTYAGMCLIYSPPILARLGRYRSYRKNYQTIFSYNLSGLGSLTAGFIAFGFIPIGVKVALENLALPFSVLVGRYGLEEKEIRPKLSGSLLIALGATLVVFSR